MAGQRKRWLDEEEEDLDGFDSLDFDNDRSTGAPPMFMSLGASLSSFGGILVGS
jgi:hypothetical protein